MSTLMILFFFLVLAVSVAITSGHPEGARPAARTRLMSAARVVLVLVGAVLLLTAVRA